jgi:hypothetical protein
MKKFKSRTGEALPENQAMKRIKRKIRKNNEYVLKIHFIVGSVFNYDGFFLL